MRPSYNIAGRKQVVYCKEHAEEGMVYVRNRRRWYNSCTKVMSYNYEGIKPAVSCKLRTEGGMTDVNYRQCLHDSCTNRPGYSAGKNIAYCKQHDENSKTGVESKPSSNPYFSKEQMHIVV